jgi:hypothetical protein
VLEYSPAAPRDHAPTGHDWLVQLGPDHPAVQPGAEHAPSVLPESAAHPRPEDDHPARLSEPHREPETPRSHDRPGEWPDTGAREHSDPGHPDPDHTQPVSPDPGHDQPPSRPAEPKPNLGDLFPPEGLPVDEARLLPHFRRAIDGVYGGLRVHVEEVTGDWATLTVRSKIYDANGMEVGHAGRSYHKIEGRIVANHFSFWLNKNFRGHGCATDFNNAMFSWYKDSGVDKVTLRANIDVGSYAWARQGFEFDQHQQAVDRIRPRLVKQIARTEEEIEQLKTQLGSLPEGEQKPMKRRVEKLASAVDDARELLSKFVVGSPDFPTPRQIVDLGRPEGLLPGESRGLQWLGKRVLIEENAEIHWHGVKKFDKE